MGWDFTLHPAEPGEIMKAFTKPWANNGSTYQVTDASWHGWRELWGVHRVNGEAKEIVLWLVDRRKDSWGYKEMTEATHPFYYGCPLKLLKITPEKCAEWREKVREYHAKRRRTFAVGSRIKLIGRRIGRDSAPVVQLTSLHPLRAAYYGITYRLSKAILADAETIE